MGTDTYFKPGDHNAVCFECGHYFKASELKKHWQGYYVCPAHWEARHPQDYVRAIQEKPTPPWAQPVPADAFRAFCTPNDSTPIPRRALPGCVKPGSPSPFYNSAETLPD